MNAQQLAQAARADAKQYAGVFSDEIVRKLELAYVAQWLDMQDVGHLTEAGRTAYNAIDSLRVCRPAA
jgi:hypothetical protein